MTQRDLERKHTSCRVCILFFFSSRRRHTRSKRDWSSDVLFRSWAPVIGDPLCVVAGWLKMPFWPCVFYMAIGKFLRYVIITAALLHLPNGFWAELLDWLE